MTYVFSHGYPRKGGFPHSEIAGSQVVCYLTDAYRKLQRPSSPSAAKASTRCASMLDHIIQHNFVISRAELGGGLLSVMAKSLLRKQTWKHW